MTGPNVDQLLETAASGHTRYTSTPDEDQKKIPPNTAMTGFIVDHLLEAPPVVAPAPANSTKPLPPNRRCVLNSDDAVAYRNTVTKNLMSSVNSILSKNAYGGLSGAKKTAAGTQSKRASMDP